MFIQLEVEDILNNEKNLYKKRIKSLEKNII